MSLEHDMEVLGGLPVTIAFELEEGDPDTGICSGVGEWWIVAIAGRPVKACDWLYRRIKEADEEDEILEALRDACEY